MQLDARLQALADYVESGSRVADVGTDHAYLAAALIEQEKAEHVIACDKNTGPCEAARRTVQSMGLANKVEVRCGDGLAVLKSGEVDVICIAGMGGQLIRDILKAHIEIIRETKMLILQPQNAAAELRSWIYRNGWHIDDESLVISEGRIYEIIKAVPGGRKRPAPILLTIGPKLWEKKPSCLRHHIEALLFQARRAAAGMEKSEKAKQSAKYHKIKERIHELEERLKW